MFKSQSLNNLQNIEWQDNEEVFLRKLHIETYQLYLFWNKKSKKYRKSFIRFNIPLIFFNAINGIIALVLTQYISQTYVSQINAIISISSSIMGSLNILLKINDKYGNSLLTASKFHRLSIKISKELNLTKEKRLLSGKDFVNQCIDEYNSIFENADPIYDENNIIKSSLLLADTEYVINSKKISFDGIRNLFNKRISKYSKESSSSKIFCNYEKSSDENKTHIPTPIGVYEDTNDTARLTNFFKRADPYSDETKKYISPLPKQDKKVSFDYTLPKNIINRTQSISSSSNNSLQDQEEENTKNISSLTSTSSKIPQFNPISTIKETEVHLDIIPLPMKNIDELDTK